MVTLLLGVALLQAPGLQNNPDSMMPKIFTKITGTNGYEEYVRAADIAMRQDFKQFNNYLNYRRPPDDTEDTVERPPDVLPNDSDLAIRRKFRAKFERCIALIQAGNAKQVYDPRDTVHAATLFPEYASFKQIARFETSAARVSFADGQTGEGLQRLEELFVFSAKMSNSILIARLVGIACDSIGMRELDQRWPQLCLSDAEEVESFMRQRLAAPNLLTPAIEREKGYAHTMINDILVKPDSVKDIFGGDDPKLSETLAGQTPDQMTKVATGVLAETDAFYDKLINFLNGPEKGWLSYQDPDDTESQKPGSQTLTKALASMILPTFSGAIVAEEADRTRFRIALLTAKAVQYRWLTGHFPDKLEDFAPAADRFDPTGGVFKYVPTENWFRILRVSKDALNERLYPPKVAPDAPAPSQP